MYYWNSQNCLPQYSIQQGLYSNQRNLTRYDDFWLSLQQNLGLRFSSPPTLPSTQPWIVLGFRIL
ncbi:hypothetical protein Lalb_Chr02g0140981 [Lupinus albus]|uniref:Uncharacterized protein n=1 Tax=Lupinus albus TaxID=3870 RepID=A0A6A4QZ30_LUPAL|nr:hypothetical protein Lalb_Chr02g0140981 [Lupinus albus]